MADLLDDIAAMLGLQCLSDLHTNTNIQQMMKNALRNIPSGQYSIKQWTEAVRYIKKDSTLTPKTEQEARQMLCETSK